MSWKDDRDLYNFLNFLTYAVPIALLLYLMIGTAFGAVAITNLTSSKDDTNLSAYTTASITPPANELIVISILSRAVSGSTNTPTITGNGLTWVLIDIEAGTDGSNKVSMFRAMGTAPTTGNITISMGGQTQLYAYWNVVSFSGVDITGTNGSGAVRQYNSNYNEGTNSGLSITLASFNDTNNIAYGAVRAGNTITAGSGFTEITEQSGEAIFETEWKNSQDTTVDWSWSSTSAYTRGVAIEVQKSNEADPTNIEIGLGITLLLLTSKTVLRLF